MQRHIRFGLGVNPDKPRRRIPVRLDQIQLVAHDSSANRVAADDRAGRRANACRRRQYLTLTVGHAIVARAYLDPRRGHARRVDALGQLAQHPRFQFIDARRVDPRRHPRLAIHPRRQHDREAHRTRDGEVDVGPPPHAHRCTLDQRGDALRRDLGKFRGHHRNHLLRRRQPIARRRNRPQVHKEMFMRQDHAQFVRRAWSQRRQ